MKLSVLISVASSLCGWAADFQFAIIGDRTGEAQPGIYEEVWREVGRERPAFAIGVGDTIQGGNDGTADREWRIASEIWRRYRLTFYLTPGNHDIWSAESEKLYEKYSGRPAFYSFDFQGAHFTVLDNSRSNDLSDEQLKFLERDLNGHHDRALKFVFFHRPNPWLIPLKFQSDFPLHALFVKYGVTAVLSGHTHQFDRMVRDGIEYICVCSSGGHLRIPAGRDGFGGGWFYGHILARVDGARVKFQVKEIDAPLGKGRGFDAGNWPIRAGRTQGR